MHYIFWFRKDLRLTDNHALSEFLNAVSDTNSFSFLYIKNKNSFSYFGEKRINFLYECLESLEKELNSYGFKLQVKEGTSREVFGRILKNHKIVSLYLNKQVEPYCISRDRDIKEIIESNGGRFNSFTDSTLFAMGNIVNAGGQQYKVYTPFRNQAVKEINESHYGKFECDFKKIKRDNEVMTDSADNYNFRINCKSLSKSELIKGGRDEGIRLLKEFYEKGLNKYKTNRDYPSVKGTSFLSPHLHFGTVSIREVYRSAKNKSGKANTDEEKSEIQTWINEIIWREFYYQIAYHNPQIQFESFKKEYDRLEWNDDNALFKLWCEGKTGYPIVDAGMRQLNSEGWMHNRIRMITAMFLTKDLFIDWRKGEKYFADKLIDLDFSNNNGGWQWSASTGVDSQPYFRIFNPYLQSRKFDANGDYIKRYLPELKTLPVEFVHEPHIMNESEQKKYKVIIGRDYPSPVTDHKVAKDIVLREFRKISESN